MILAADMADQTLTQWIVLAVAGAILTGLGFLVRNAFEGTTSAVKELGSKLDVITAAQAKGDGDRRVLEVEVAQLKRDIAEIKQELRDLSEGASR